MGRAGAVRRILACLLLPLLLAACGAEPKWAPQEEIQRVAYRADGPAKLTLFTVINNRSNSGAHSALMINGSQRVIFDPAGTWWHHSIPERNDVHYGITPRVLEFYVDYHARESYRVVMQEIVVSPEVAEMALREVQAYGAVPKAFCARSTSTILSRLPGFGSIRPTFYPKNLRRQFARIPGVKERVIHDYDDDDHSALLTAQNKQPAIAN